MKIIQICMYLKLDWCYITKLIWLAYLFNPFLLYLTVLRLFYYFDHFTYSRSRPKHRTTQTQNKHIHIPNIHALCGIRTQDPGFRASEDSTCLRPLGYRDRQIIWHSLKKKSPWHSLIKDFDLSKWKFGSEHRRNGTLCFMNLANSKSW
jgi:hypothetical protein